jgi:hypothetical protein
MFLCKELNTILAKKMRMKKWLLLLILLIPLAAADDIFLSESLLLDIKITGEYTLRAQRSGSVDFVRALFEFYPLEGFDQETVTIKTSPAGTFKDDSIEFYWEVPQISKHNFFVESRVNTYNKFRQVNKKVAFPIKNPEKEEYLKATEKIDITPEIIAKASEIAEGEDDAFIVAFKLASWTKQNINYSITTLTVDASQPASWVLENRYGVCDELTNLFIAMARSLGIPARFVSGLSFTNDERFTEEWGLHGWAEVYFPGYGWVPFDPTYGQYGYVDATHVKLSDSLDSDKSSTRYEWQSSGGVELIPSKLNTEVSVIEQSRNIPEITKMELKAFGDQVSFGSYNLIEARLRNTKNYYVGFEAVLTLPKEVKNLNERRQYVVLRPNEEKSVFWVVQVTEELSRNYIYTFPMEISNTLGSSAKGSFKASHRNITYSVSQVQNILSRLNEQEKKVYSRNVLVNCTSPKAVYADETFQISCNIKNSGNIFLRKVNICLEKDCRTADIGITQSIDIVFEKELSEIREQELTVTAKNSEISSFQTLRIISMDRPKLSIEKVEFPETVSYGPEFTIGFDIWKHSYSPAQNVTLKMLINGKETRWDIEELESNQAFSVNVDKSMLNPKDNNFRIIVLYHDLDKITYSEEITKGFEVQASGIFDRLMMWLNKISRDIDNLFG